MKKIFLVWFLVFLLVPIFIFGQEESLNECIDCSESGGFVPCGRKCDDPFTAKNECFPCTLCDFFVMIDKIIDDFVLKPLIPVLVLLIIGIMAMTVYARRGAPEIINKIKRALTGVVVGVIIIYAAWAIVNTVLLATGAASWAGFNELWVVNCPEPETEEIELVRTFCGDGIIQRPNNDDFVEICDGYDLGGQTCKSRGFESGDLVCHEDCSGFDEVGCVEYSMPALLSLPTPVPMNPEPLVSAPTGISSVVITVRNPDGAGFPYPSGDVACAKYGFAYCEIVQRAAVSKYSDLGGDPYYNNTPCDHVFGDGIHDGFRHDRPVLEVRCHVCPAL